MGVIYYLFGFIGVIRDGVWVGIEVVVSIGSLLFYKLFRLDVLVVVFWRFF